MSRVSWPAVRSGAIIAVAICLPLSIIGTVVVDTDDRDPGNLAAAFYAAVLVGFAIGGWVAAQRAGDTPYSSGAVSALVAYAAIAVVSVLANVVRDDGIDVIVLVANGLLAYGAGLLGAVIVVRRRAT